MSYQRFLFWPGTPEKHPVSQRYGGNLLKLKRAKLKSQNPVTVNGDPVPAFHSDFLAFPCLEMVPKEICSVTFMETKVKLTSLQFLRPTLLEDDLQHQPLPQSLGTFHNHTHISEIILSSLAMASTMNTSHLVPCTHVCPFCFTSP